jgi:hypothetical protein
MKYLLRPFVVTFLTLPICLVLAENQVVPLLVPAGVPLRVYLTKRLPKRTGEPVEAKLLEPLFVFDRQVAPAGSQVLGHVTSLEPVSKKRRVSAILGGDFTPLHEANVQFTTLVLPDGRRVQLDTAETIGLNTIVPAHPPKPKNPPQQSGKGGVLGTGKRQAQAQIDAAKAKVQGVADMVRGPDKWQLLEEYFLAKLPYHPQWVRKGTRFDAELRQPLQFGDGTIPAESLTLIGTQPPADSIAHVRLLTALDSGTAKQGQDVEAVLSQPVFAGNKLILPEGTRVTGVVTVAQRARWFHRGGQLRFNLQHMDLPSGPGRPPLPPELRMATRTQATLAAAESGSKNPVKVDEEGSVKATESKTRFIAPAISILIAHRAADNDEGRRSIQGSGANEGGRTLGGGFGFGLLGAAAAQASRNVGAAFGFYGMGWSVFNNIIARGSEVQFNRNAAMDIRFGARTPAPATKFQAARLHAATP